VTAISGWVAPGWEGVREAFQANFDARAEVGAAFSAYHRGASVVDLWGGVADETKGTPWEEDTLVLVYSTTKGITAMCANMLAQSGALDLDAPVADYWPEFAEAGKEQVTVTDLLSHRAGLAWVDGTMSVDDMLAWDPVIRALERQTPSWPPGTAHGYHATTYGWLVGEVIRRVSGKSVGAYVRDEVAGPLEADWYIGLPASEERRVARLVSFLDSLTEGLGLERLGAGAGAGPGAGPDLEHLANLAATYFAPDGPLFKALTAPGGSLSDPQLWHSPRLHAAELPAANGICDARSLARLYAACVSDVRAPSGEKIRLLTADQLERALVQQTEGPDQVLLGLDIQWGLGFIVNRGIIAAAGLGGPRGFGHFGMGGSGGWADADAELAMGYVMNRMDIGTTGDTRSFRLMQACFEAARRS